MIFYYVDYCFRILRNLGDIQLLIGLILPICHIIALSILVISRRVNVVVRVSYLPNAAAIVAIMLPPDFVYERFGYWRAFDLALGIIISSALFLILAIVSAFIKKEESYDCTSRVFLLAPVAFGLVIPVLFGYDFMFPFR